MREIKFRAWDGINFYTPIIDGSHIYRNSFDHQDNNPAINDNLMQYTGLKDKIGKEIYEGDIVGRKSPNTGETYYYTVEWDGGNARFIAVGKTVQELVSAALERGYEWAGNIYDHPHLLEKGAEG